MVTNYKSELMYQITMIVNLICNESYIWRLAPRSAVIKAKGISVSRNPNPKTALKMPIPKEPEKQIPIRIKED